MANSSHDTSWIEISLALNFRSRFLSSRSSDSFCSSQDVRQNDYEKLNLFLPSEKSLIEFAAARNEIISFIDRHHPWKGPCHDCRLELKLFCENCMQTETPNLECFDSYKIQLGRVKMRWDWCDKPPSSCDDNGSLKVAQSLFTNLHHISAPRLSNSKFIRLRLVSDIGTWTILGQSFGRFCNVTYLSLASQNLKKGLITGGLPPVGSGCTTDSVYMTCLHQIVRQNEKYYKRSSQDVEIVLDVAVTKPLDDGIEEFVYETFLAFEWLLGSKGIASRGLEILAAMEQLSYVIHQSRLILVELEDSNMVFLKGAEGELKATDEIYKLMIEEDCKARDPSNALKIAYGKEAAVWMGTTSHFNWLLSVQATSRILEIAFSTFENMELGGVQIKLNTETYNKVIQAYTRTMMLGRNNRTLVCMLSANIRNVFVDIVVVLLAASVILQWRHFLLDWFHIPRPPELTDLEDKVNFKGRGMLRMSIIRTCGT